LFGIGLLPIDMGRFERPMKALPQEFEANEDARRSRL
jgi:hypothetical protein